MNGSLHECEKTVVTKVESHNVDCNEKVNTAKAKFERCLNFQGSGLCAVFMSALFYSINAIFVKMLSNLHPLQIAMSRFAVQFILLLPFITHKRNEEDILGKPGLRKFMWIRGLCGAAGMMCIYSAISYLRVADAATLAYSRMMFIPFIARILLREKISTLELILSILSLIGVVLIAKPPFIFHASAAKDFVNPIGVLLGILAALFQGTSIVLVRKLGDTYPPLSVGYYSVCGAVISIILLFSLQEFQYPCTQDLPLLFLIGFIGVAGQYLLTIGLQRERAGSVAVLLSLQLIIVNVLQVSFSSSSCILRY